MPPATADVFECGPGVGAGVGAGEGGVAGVVVDCAGVGGVDGCGVGGSVVAGATVVVCTPLLHSGHWISEGKHFFLEGSAYALHVFPFVFMQGPLVPPVHPVQSCPRHRAQIAIRNNQRMGTGSYSPR